MNKRGAEMSMVWVGAIVIGLAALAFYLFGPTEQITDLQKSALRTISSEVPCKTTGKISLYYVHEIENGVHEYKKDGPTSLQESFYRLASVLGPYKQMKMCFPSFYVPRIEADVREVVQEHLKLVTKESVDALGVVDYVKLVVAGMRYVEGIEIPKEYNLVYAKINYDIPWDAIPIAHQSKFKSMGYDPETKRYTNGCDPAKFKDILADLGIEQGQECPTPRWPEKSKV